MQTNHITLAEAAKRSPGRPSVNAIWRWCRKGIKSRSGDRIHLDHIRIGGKIYTSPESLEKFFAAVADADRQYFFNLNPPRIDKHPFRLEKSRQQDIKLAEQQLMNAGF